MDNKRIVVVSKILTSVSHGMLLENKTRYGLSCGHEVVRSNPPATRKPPRRLSCRLCGDEFKRKLFSGEQIP